MADKTDLKPEETVAEPIAATPEAAVEQPLEDAPADPNALSVAPPRPHQSLVDQLQMRWHEIKDFVSRLDGTVEGELGDVLELARRYSQA